MWKNLLQKFKPTPKLSNGLVFAFECGGKNYYKYADINTMPALRALQTMTFFHELQMGVSKEYLTKHMAKMKELLSNPKAININELIKVNYWLEERLKFVISKDIIYNVASVSFIEDGEDPTNYDELTNKRKIENWKQNKADGFFLDKNLTELVPFLHKYGSYSPTYLAAVEKIEAALSDLELLNKYVEELKIEKD